jgi:hypothetical protein
MFNIAVMPDMFAARYFYIVDRIKSMIISGGQTSSQAKSNAAWATTPTSPKSSSSAHPTHIGAKSPPNQVRNYVEQNLAYKTPHCRVPQRSPYDTHRQVNRRLLK